MKYNIILTIKGNDFYFFWFNVFANKNCLLAKQQNINLLYKRPDKKCLKISQILIVNK